MMVMKLFLDKDTILLLIISTPLLFVQIGKGNVYIANVEEINAKCLMVKNKDILL